LKELVATGLYVGYIARMPGMCAALATVAVFVAAGGPVGIGAWAALAVLIILSAFSLSHCEAVFGACDPKQVVIDEIIGMWLALIVGGSAEWIMLAIGFGLFRLLDIAKPGVIGRAEWVPGWRGVVGDDVVAGLVAGLGVRVLAGAIAA
jgi:phosphatidylglycerophosphatase A